MNISSNLVDQNQGSDSLGRTRTRSRAQTRHPSATTSHGTEQEEMEGQGTSHQYLTSPPSSNAAERQIEEEVGNDKKVDEKKAKKEKKEKKDKKAKKKIKKEKKKEKRKEKEAQEVSASHAYIR